MSDLREVVKSKLFGGKVRFRSEEQKKEEQTDDVIPVTKSVEEKLEN